MLFLSGEKKMKATAKKYFKISLNGYDVFSFNEGDIIEGELAHKAVECGHADAIKAPKETKPKAPKVKK